MIFSALLVPWPEGHPTCNKISKVFIWDTFKDLSIQIKVTLGKLAGKTKTDNNNNISSIGRY